MGYDLTTAEHLAYREQGYIGPFALLDERAIHAVLDEGRKTRALLPWYKGHHVYRGPIVEALRSAPVVDRVASILGDDVMLWGSQVMTKRSGEDHRWHVDIETMAWTSVNVWAALKNVSADATVLLLPGTQRIRMSPQELQRAEGLDVGDSQAVRAAAERLGVSSDIVTVVIRPGEFVIFDGHLWHGSVNKTRQVRSALLAQYSPTSARARVPRTYTPPIQWDPEPAPVLLVRGQDRGSGNRFVEPVPPPGNAARTIARARQVAKRVTSRRKTTRSAGDVVSVCIVGTGSAAERHVRALRSVAGDRVRISAVGRDPERVAAWVAAAGLARAYASVEEALAGGDDIVVVATPPTSHAPLVDAAMSAGKHILVEKPAFRTLDELADRLPAIRSYGPAWMVAENSHFAPLQRLILERLRAGAIGKPLIANIVRLRKRLPAQEWKAHRTESDGALNEGGIHWIRAGLALTGVRSPNDVEWVFAAQPGVKTATNDGDDTAVVTWRARGGALGELGHSWGLEGGRLPLRSSIIGTDGAIYFDPSGRLATLSTGRNWLQRPLVPWREMRAHEDLSGTDEMWRGFLESVRSGAPVAHTVEEAAADLGVIDAAYRAMRSCIAEPIDPRLTP